MRQHGVYNHFQPATLCDRTTLRSPPEPYTTPTRTSCAASMAHVPSRFLMGSPKTHSAVPFPHSPEKAQEQLKKLKTKQNTAWYEFQESLHKAREQHVAELREMQTKEEEVLVSELTKCLEDDKRQLIYLHKAHLNAELQKMKKRCLGRNCWVLPRCTRPLSDWRCCRQCPNNSHRPPHCAR